MRLLERLRFAKKRHTTDREYQFRQEGSHDEVILRKKSENLRAALELA
ncbi:hypothetical protein [Thiohalocapsa halophila]|nr:hypothetical protein [Thiohalocapsa halophila]